ncbi:MAG TPA: single-stranded DNA-binding protein [Candidatus Scatomorpha stercorigallinarum]|nr:single-stranded DNA-binding protein [Candidatus Scatomorpha stercorigallinarum]
MDEALCRNTVELCGALAAAPRFSHLSRGERFFIFPVETRRLSGAVDTINVVAREALLAALRIEEAERLCVQGELRSFNNRREEGPKLVITVFARALSLAGGGEDVNSITLRGALCKQPVLRVTPMGRDICDLMLAVNRRCGRSDYLPCICWGARARTAALFDVGDGVELTGRVQSRQYIKLIDGEPVEKTAYEVSASEIRLASAARSAVGAL